MEAARTGWEGEHLSGAEAEARRLTTWARQLHSRAEAGMQRSRHLAGDMPGLPGEQVDSGVAEDALHWLAVYQQLVSVLPGLAEHSPDSLRLRTADLERRLRYWERRAGRLVAAPVAEPAARGPLPCELTMRAEHFVDRPEPGALRDPVCGRSVCPATAAAQRVSQGRRAYFCSTACADRLSAEPERYTSGRHASGSDASS
jgi:YHS domain-containing protein